MRVRKLPGGGGFKPTEMVGEGALEPWTGKFGVEVKL
jgi:hypothetical protein